MNGDRCRQRSEEPTTLLPHLPATKPRIAPEPARSRAARSRRRQPLFARCLGAHPPCGHRRPTGMARLPIVIMEAGSRPMPVGAASWTGFKVGRPSSSRAPRKPLSGAQTSHGIVFHVIGRLLALPNNCALDRGLYPPGVRTISNCQGRVRSPSQAPRSPKRRGALKDRQRHIAPGRLSGDGCRRLGFFTPWTDRSRPRSRERPDKRFLSRAGVLE